MEGSLSPKRLHGIANEHDPRAAGAKDLRVEDPVPAREGGASICGEKPA
jgi:hypothetical protein